MLLLLLLPVIFIGFCLLTEGTDSPDCPVCPTAESQIFT